VDANKIRFKACNAKVDDKLPVVIYFIVKSASSARLLVYKASVASQEDGDP